MSLSDNEQTIVSNIIDESNGVNGVSNKNSPDLQQQDVSHSSEYKDEHFFSWLIHMCKLK